MVIRTDCYIAVLKKFKRKYPKAHFEIITRSSHHPLSPSWKLLTSVKENNISFKKYTFDFIKEIYNNPMAKEKIKYLRRLAKKKTVFLVCYEEDERKCHRSIVKKMIEGKL